ncbi:hypothetical protein H6G10_13785 [Anabaena cylindrica FACHB-170]|nr:hypothetical protein [Anabaena cylindrica FACHB-170]
MAACAALVTSSRETLNAESALTLSRMTDRNEIQVKFLQGRVQVISYAPS